MKKLFWLMTVLVLAGVLLLFIGKAFSPGSYPDAEKFEMDMSEADLIELLGQFKRNNPQYQVPSHLGLTDGRASEADHWYHLYFYYPHEDQIIYAWTRPIGPKKTTLAFVSVNVGLELGHWKDINKDFGSTENADQIRKFEDRILHKLRKKLSGG